jgi:hypothetical protein
MNLKNLMVDTKSAWVPYEGFEGFEVQVANISREKLTKLRKSCVEKVFDRKIRGQIEELNESKFVRAFTDNAVLDWKGLKLSYVEQLMLVDIEAQDPNAELPYDKDNAELLVKNSADFDTWLNEVVFDLDNFRSVRD